MTQNLLEVDSITCCHEKREVVTGVSFSVAAGSVACLLGPSGCGKTTVLRAIAGFHPLDSGVIRMRGGVVSQLGYRLAPEQRRVGMVFQDGALFPHLNVYHNVAFGLRDGSEEQRRRDAQQLLQRVGLVDMQTRYPHELSGGQQQRVALARALAPKPDLVLMDEPFSNLDLDLRERLSIEVRDILKEKGITCLLVTHDQYDAFALGDHVGVMSAGEIIQWDSPYNLYHEPANRFVADFIGDGVFLPGTLLTPDTIQTELGVVTGERGYGDSRGASMDVLIRPDDIVPDPDGPFRATVVRKAFKGAEILYTLRLADGSHVLSLFPSHSDHALGEIVRVRLQADHVVAFADGS